MALDLCGIEFMYGRIHEGVAAFTLPVTKNPAPSDRCPSNPNSYPPKISTIRCKRSPARNTDCAGISTAAVFDGCSARIKVTPVVIDVFRWPTVQRMLIAEQSLGLRGPNRCRKHT